jgi:hypothetical protein
MPASTEIIDLEENYYGLGQPGRRIPVDVKPRILYAIASIEYGSVEVVIHDGKITQIECREKIRMGLTEAGNRLNRSYRYLTGRPEGRYRREE